MPGGMELFVAVSKISSTRWAASLCTAGRRGIISYSRIARASDYAPPPCLTRTINCVNTHKCNDVNTSTEIPRAQALPAHPYRHTGGSAANDRGRAKINLAASATAQYPNKRTPAPLSLGVRRFSIRKQMLDSIQEDVRQVRSAEDDCSYRPGAH